MYIIVKIYFIYVVTNGLRQIYRGVSGSREK